VVDVLANDSDPDEALDPTTLRIVEPPNPASGTARVNADGTVTYTLGSSYSGADSFRYEVCDDGAPRQCGLRASISRRRRSRALQHPRTNRPRARDR